METEIVENISDTPIVKVTRTKMKVTVNLSLKKLRSKICFSLRNMGVNNKLNIKLCINKLNIKHGILLCQSTLPLLY